MEFQSAEVVLPCSELAATLAFFTERLAFRLETVFPADDPRVAVVSGHGVRLRLERGAAGAPGVLRLACAALGSEVGAEVGAGVRAHLMAPNGTRIELVPEDPPLVLPPLQPAFVVSRADAGDWVTGRAGMRYRDLIPGRQGGRFVASHIRIPDGGPVPDSVHYHRVRFQMIYCRAGWVRVVYEDQGPPFVLNAGDCVLQPSGIRHRVLESSPGLEVIEVSCPAEHMTTLDHDLELPTSEVRSERDFDGQRFVRHVAAEAPWRPWRLAGFEARDLGFYAATGGLASAHVVRRSGSAQRQATEHDGELLFTCVLHGAVTLERGTGEGERLITGAGFVAPAGESYSLAGASDDVELLEVRVQFER